MKTSVMEKTQKQLIKRFKTLLNVGGIDRNAELAILSGYGVESCKDMDAYQLIDLCNRLEKEVQPEFKEMDTARKRLIKAIDEYRKAMGAVPTIEDIKDIACRASKCSNFNYIPKDRLNSLYNSFKHKTKDLRAVTEITEEMMHRAAQLN